MRAHPYSKQAKLDKFLSALASINFGPHPKIAWRSGRTPKLAADTLRFF